MSHLALLETLDVAHNAIPTVDALRTLSSNTRLHALVVAGNPVAASHRLIVNILPSLIELNGEKCQHHTRTSAAAMVLTGAGVEGARRAPLTIADGLGHSGSAAALASTPSAASYANQHRRASVTGTGAGAGLVPASPVSAAQPPPLIVPSLPSLQTDSALATPLAMRPVPVTPAAAATPAAAGSDMSQLGAAHALCQEQLPVIVRVRGAGF